MTPEQGADVNACKEDDAWPLRGQDERLNPLDPHDSLLWGWCPHGTGPVMGTGP